MKTQKEQKMNFRGKSIKKGVITLRELYMYELGIKEGRTQTIAEVMEIINRWENKYMEQFADDCGYFYYDKWAELKAKLQSPNKSVKAYDGAEKTSTQQGQTGSDTIQKAISEFEKIIDSICYCSLVNNPKHNSINCCLCLTKDRFRLKLLEMINKTAQEITG